MTDKELESILIPGRATVAYVLIKFLLELPTVKALVLILGGKDFAL